MIIYGEILFVENMIIGGVLLYLTGEICGMSRAMADKIRFVIGSIMCGVFSLTIFLDVKGAALMLMEFLFAVCVCTVVFGSPSAKCGTSEKCYLSPKGIVSFFSWRTAAVFIVVTYFMGGIIMALLLATRQQGIHSAAGIYTGDMKAAVLAIFICLGAATVKQIVKTVRKKKIFTEHSYEAEIVIGEHIFKASAFLDTGNRLKDPLTGKPVAVAAEKFWKQMIEQMDRQGTGSDHIGTRFAVIPYETVGHKGMLKAVRADLIRLGSRQIKGGLIACSDKGFSLGENSGYDMLISGEMI